MHYKVHGASVRWVKELWKLTGCRDLELDTNQETLLPVQCLMTRPHFLQQKGFHLMCCIVCRYMLSFINIDLKSGL